MPHLALVLVLAAGLVGVASASRGPENEMSVLHPETFTDLTLGGPTDLGSRPDVGVRVGARMAVDDAGTSTLEILNATTTGLQDGDWIVIRVNNTAARGISKKAAAKQWVGLFAPAGAAVNTIVPVKYSLASADAGFTQDGVAVLSFQLFNVRVPYDVVFLDNCSIPLYYYNDKSIRNCVATHRVGPITFADPNQPLRPAVLVTGEPTTVRVAWTSAQVVFPYVQFRPLPDGRPPAMQFPSEPTTEFPFLVNATSAAPAYQASDMCGDPAATYGFFDPGARHTALLTGLRPGSWYSYRFGDSSGSPVSDEFALWVPPAPGPEATVTLLTFGDLGRGTLDGSMTWMDYARPALKTTGRMAAEIAGADPSLGIGDDRPIDGIFHIGDISYAVGFLSIWDLYAQMMTPVIAHSPYALLVGNHESDTPAAVTPQDRVVTLYNGTDGGGECSVPTNGWYPMPWVSVDKPWFSYEVGPVHITGMSTEHDFRVGSEQHSWIRADLAAVNRSRTPWVVFGGHRPMYVDSTYASGWGSDGGNSQLLVDNVEPLLLEYGVDLAVWGHNHAVQRMCALRKFQCVEMSDSVMQPSDDDDDVDESGRSEVEEHVYTKGSGGVVHLVIGAAGASFTKNVHNPPLPTTEEAMYVYGHSILRAEGAERLTWRWIANDDGLPKDSLVIQDASLPPPAPPAKGGLDPSEVAGIVVGATAVIGVAMLAFVYMRGGKRPCSASVAGRDERTPFVDAADGEAVSGA